MPLRLPICLPLLLVSAAAWAEEPPVEEIVVTGQGLDPSSLQAAYSATTIERDRTAASASGRIEDVLALAAGLQQFRRSDSRSANPSAQGATLRGLGGNASSRTLVLLDAVPVTDPFFGYVPFSALPFERLGRVTVIRGGGSGAFGAGAVAGTLDLASASPSDLPLAEASMAANDRGESELYATLAPQLGGGFLVASGRWDRGQGFWTTPTAQRGPASARARFDSWSSSLRAVAPLSGEVELQARVLLFDDRRTLRFKGADSSSSGQDASLRLVGRGDWQFDVLGYVQARDFSNVVISATSFRKTLDQRATPSTGLGGKIELRPPLGNRNPLRLGADWRRASGTMFEDAYSAATGLLTARRRAGGVNDDIGLFLEGDVEAGPLRLTGSARLDRWSVREGFFEDSNAVRSTCPPNRIGDRSGWQESLRGGMVISPGRGIALRASAYSGLRQPTLNELYRPFTVFPVTTCANAALANELLRGFEAGFDWQPNEAVSVQFTAFDNRVKGAIANVTIGPNLRERRNLDAVRGRGIEAAVRVKLGQVEWDAAMSLVDAEVEASGASLALDAKRPAQVPRFTANSTLAWRPAQGWLFAGSLRHTSAQFEDDLGVDRLPAVTTFDAWANLPLSRHVSLILRAENIADEAVITRNVAGSIDFGAPRTLWAGLRISFGR